MLSAETAVALLRALRGGGVDPCLSGGWAVDALFGRQTRDHDDLDLWLLAEEFEAAIVVLAECGVDRLLPWGDDRPWNFVLHDGRGVRVDLHLYERLADGSVHYGSVLDGHRFPAAALAGEGVIDGYRVRCEAPEWALRWRTGYPPREVDHHDVALLRRMLG